MTAPPLPTTVPQTAWYDLAIGNVTPSGADPVPSAAYLQSSGDDDGLVGSLNGEVIYLGGLATLLDGGQKWLMWVAASLDADDGTDTFCPYVDDSTPGRWKNTGTVMSGAGAVIATQLIAAGDTKNIAAATSPIVNVLISTRDSNTATTLNMPGTTFLGQTINIKDTNGDAGTYAINVTAPNIDGDTSDPMITDFAARSYVWNGTYWSRQ